MTVTVTPPYQVVHQGRAYTGGDTLDVDEGTARRWIARGWAAPAKGKSKGKGKG